MAIRDYQRKWLDEIYAAWAGGAQNVFATLPTGAGKTFCFVTAIRERKAPSVIVAHRMELLAQAALALNREQMPHSIEAPDATVREIIKAQMTTHGRTFYSERAPVHVAGVHTLAARGDRVRWARNVEMVVIDEGHHVTNGGGIWSRALGLFPGARGLFPSAHAVRADGRGLGRGADGMADALVVGPSARNLINRGFLSDYRVAVPPADVDMSAVSVTASGDFSHVQLAAAVRAAPQLVGHVAEHYARLAGGKLGLTFAVDIESAHKLAHAYVALGVPAAVITGATPIDERAELMAKFRARKLLQLVSVDVLGEGTDVPDVEVVSMARPTASFQLYCQMLGRALRVSVEKQYADHWDKYSDTERLAIIAASAKPRALILDHAGNFTRHYAKTGGPPCSAQQYSLSRVERKARGKSDAIPLRTCVNVVCLQPYERVLMACPHCGEPAPLPIGRGTPAEVDGDLVLLDPSSLKALQAEIAKIDGPAYAPKGVPHHVKKTIERNHLTRQSQQALLREAMWLYAGWRIHVHADERRAQREFFHTFGIDYMTAQTLNESDAEELCARVGAYLIDNNIEARK